MIKHFFTLLLSFIAISATAQQTIIVSTTGNDSNDGSLSSPLQTPEAALSRAKQSSEKEISIFFRAGKYYLSTPLIIKSEEFAQKKITISAYQNETVTFSGGKKLSLKWGKAKGGIFMSKVEPIVSDLLFMNGEKQILARYPNYNKDGIFNGTAADALSPERIKKWKDPKGGFIHALHGREWGDMHYVITGKKDDKLAYEGGFQNNRPSEMHNKYRFVENIFEELDAPREWFLDTKRNILYYYPAQGDKINDATFEVALLSNLVELRGTSNKRLTNVTIKNIHFIETTRTFMGEYEKLMRSDWSIFRGAALFMENTEDCLIDSCEFTNLGGNALFLSKYNRNVTVKSNHIHHIGASAICVVGDTSAVRSGSMEYGKFVPYEKLDQVPGPKNANYPRQCTIEDNLIHDIGQVEKQVAGIEVQIAAQMNIRHNTIYRVPRAAINVGDGAFGGHVIEYNDAFETVLETSDHGAFNSWGRDRFWHPDYNKMCELTTQHPELVLLDALYTTIIRNNRFRCDHGWDIDLDDGSSNYHIYNNLCLHGGIKLREGFYRTVENNILINNSLHPHVWFKNCEDVIQRNIFMLPYFPISLQSWGKKVDYNFFLTKFALDNVRQNNTDAHSVCGNVNFLNEKEGVFTLLEGSDAFKVGFENFPMDQFGVYSPQLKKIAEKPVISELVMINSDDSKKEYNWLEGRICAVNGLGDRSAFGLPDEKGVVVLDVDNSDVLKKAGIQKRDVIRAIEDVVISNVEELYIQTDKKKWKKELKVTIVRNQQFLDITVSL